MKILFIGDIVAQSGRRAVGAVLPKLIAEKKIDLVIANIENLAHGKGATEETIEEIRSYGVDVMTSGNHIWYRHEVEGILESDPSVIRPANYPSDLPGFGFTIAEVGNGKSSKDKSKVLVINLLGRQWMDDPISDPFRCIDAILDDQKKEKFAAIVVDIHAEATSEKAALAWYLDGRVTAVLGTHTHVPTCDEVVLPNGTAFVSDVGMSGAANSVLGVEPETIIKVQKDPYPQRFEWVETGPRYFRSVLIETTRGVAAKSIGRLDKYLD